MATHDDVLKLLSKLYPETDMEVLRFDIQGLSDIEPPKLLEAVREFRQTDASGFCPRPGQLRKLIGMNDSRSLAEAAWTRCLAAVRMPRPSVPLRDHPASKAYDAMWAAIHNDPATRSALEAVGGSWGLQGMLSENKYRVHAKFVAAYQEEARSVLIASGQKQIGNSP